MLITYSDFLAINNVAKSNEAATVYTIKMVSATGTLAVVEGERNISFVEEQAFRFEFGIPEAEILTADELIDAVKHKDAWVYNPDGMRPVLEAFTSQEDFSELFSDAARYIEDIGTEDEDAIYADEDFSADELDDFADMEDGSFGYGESSSRISIRNSWVARLFRMAKQH